MLVYFSKTDLSGRTAQVIQIKAMIAAFSSIENWHFSVVARGRSEDVHCPNKIVFENISVFKFYVLSFFVMLRGGKDQVYFTRDIAVVALAVVLRRKVIYEVHHPNDHCWREFITTRIASSSVVHLLFISAALQRYYKPKIYLTPEKSLVAHDGAFFNTYNPHELNRRELRAQLGYQESDVLIMHTGSLYKGGAELYSRLEHLQEFNPNIKFLHIGGSEGEVAFWNGVYSAHDGINFLPYCHPKEIKNFQMVADFLLYLNVRSSNIYWCTSPLKLFEYLASGTPVIASNIGSVKEIVNESMVSIFDPDIEGDFESAVEHAIVDVEGAKRRAIHAKAEAERQYDWGVRAGKIIQFIENYVVR